MPVSSPHRPHRLTDRSLSHMPFIARTGGRLLVLFSRTQEVDHRVPRYGRTRTGRVWKLHYTELIEAMPAGAELQTSAATRLETGLDANEVECSPCLWLAEEKVHLSFIGTSGHGTGPLRHRLYKMSGRDLNSLGPAETVSEQECFCGFWHPGMTVIGDGSGLLQLTVADGLPRELDTGFARIARVSYCADSPSLLLVTGGDRETPQRPTSSGRLDDGGLDVEPPDKGAAANRQPDDASAGLVPPAEASRPGGAELLMRTLVYDATADRVVGELQVDGRATYKPALCGDLALVPEEVPQVHRGWRLGALRRPQFTGTARRFHSKQR